MFVNHFKEISSSLIAMLIVDKNLKQAEGWKTGARCLERGGKQTSAEDPEALARLGRREGAGRREEERSGTHGG